jgi:hypothetical protein
MSPESSIVGVGICIGMLRVRGTSSVTISKDGVLACSRSVPRPLRILRVLSLRSGEYLLQVAKKTMESYVARNDIAYTNIRLDQHVPRYARKLLTFTHDEIATCKDEVLGHEIVLRPSAECVSANPGAAGITYDDHRGKAHCTVREV